MVFMLADLLGKFVSFIEGCSACINASHSNFSGGLAVLIGENYQVQNNLLDCGCSCLLECLITAPQI